MFRKPIFREGQGKPVQRIAAALERAVGLGVGQVGVGIDFPSDCGAGQYYDVLSLSCLNYGDGGYTDRDTGYVLPGTCPDGTSWSNGDCLADVTCGADEVWSPADGECVPFCAIGFQLTSFGCVPVACPDNMGRSKYAPEDSVCIECSYGKDAQGFCIDCPNGPLDPNTGLCPNPSECTSSQRMSPTTGECVECSWGIDTATDTCLVCPAGTVYTAATDTCDCPADKVWSDAAGQCVPWNPPKVTPPQGGPPVTPPPPPVTPPDDYKPPTNQIEGDTGMVGKALMFVGAALAAAAITFGIAKATKKGRK